MPNNSLTKALEMFLDGAPQPFAILDKSLRFTFVNAAMAKLVGEERGKIAGRTFADVWKKLPGAANTDLAVAMAAGRLPASATTSKDGRTHAWQAWEMDGKPGRIAVSALDVSVPLRAGANRQQAGTRIDQERRLESLKVVAGIIAHDFNNLLLGILGHTDLVLSQLPVDSVLQNNIEQIQTCAQRATDLTERMLAYSGRNNLLMEALDLSAELTAMKPTLERYLAEHQNITLGFETAADMPLVEADRKYFQLLVMNLAANAVEAIGSKPGQVRVSTGSLRADRKYLSESYLDQSVPEGDYAFVEVSDNGPGMTDNMRRLLFDPFFATNFISAGVGLPAVLGTVREHGGTIKVTTAPGKGTSMRVLFPCVELVARSYDDRPVGETTLAPAERRVLVVDDEESVLHVTRMLLERGGFKVLTATGGREAIEIVRQQGEAVGVVLLDMLMPHLDGLKTYQELERLYPGIKVIMCSGYPREEVMSRFDGKGIAGFIQKPYRAATLFSQVREQLGMDEA